MSLFWISKPVSSRIKEEAMSVTVIYYCICAFLCRVADSTHLCVICRHFCCPLLLFQGYLDYQILPYTLIGPPERGSRKKIRFTALYKNFNTFLTLWFLNANWVKNQRILVQWNPDLRPPRKYGLNLIITASFFWPGKTGIHFLVKKPLLMWSPVNTANRYIFKSQTVESYIYNFNLLIRPLVRNLEN